MGILIKNNIVNQKGTPAFYESSLATRPVANIQGRMFIDTDVPSTGIYRDNGTSWNQVADPGAGTTGTLQQVTTNGSSTTIGISTSGNGIGIGTTIPGSNRLDIHSGTGIQATFNGTGTTNAALQLQLAGVGKWNLSNLYNSAANDFIINDVVNSVNRVTVKNTGQTFIGTDTTSSGLFVVNSSTSDNHYVAIGSNAPSYRLRDVGSGGALNCGIGISTAVNNFIQGSASGNFCFFNSSTTASPILFGVYDAGAGNTQEAIRISSARNLLIGTTTDAGYKLDVNGTGRFSGDVSVIKSSPNINLNGTSGTSAQYNINNSSGTLHWAMYSTIGGAGVQANWQLYSAGKTGGSGNIIDITPAGAATFSSSVTAATESQFTGTSVNSRILITASGVANTVIGFNNSGATATGVINNASYIGNLQPYPLIFTTDSVERLRIASTGDATFSSTIKQSSAATTTGATAEFYNASSVGYGMYIQAGTTANYSLLVTNYLGATAFQVLGNGSATFSSSIAIGNTVTASVLNTVTNKVSIIIGGVQYYLLASTSAV